MKHDATKHDATVHAGRDCSFGCAVPCNHPDCWQCVAYKAFQPPYNVDGGTAEQRAQAALSTQAMNSLPVALPESLRMKEEESIAANIMAADIMSNEPTAIANLKRAGASDTDIEATLALLNWASRHPAATTTGEL